MAIAFKKFVDITSGVGGGAAVRQRELIGRLFTTNPLLPTKTLAEFTTLEEVGNYFGTTSEEYKRALFYFGWISKSITKAQKIAFARWADVAVAPRIYGVPGGQALGAWTSINNGSFSLTMGGFTFVVSTLDFSAAGSLAAVATIIQTGVQSKTGGGALWTGATVSYDATRGSFNLVGGATGAAVISVAAGGVGTDIADQLGWLSPDTILSNGSAAESITTVLTESAGVSDNFGSFLFLPGLTNDQIEEAAEWNDEQNVKFIYCVPVTRANASAYYTLLSGLSGVAVTLSEIADQYPEQVPMMILAATDYSRRNAVQNYMFQIFTLTPGVTTTAISDELDLVRCNYYGRTQTAGQLIDFYQRGTMMGLATDPVDQNVYANEIWLKDAAGAKIMELLLALPRISANAQGRGQLISVLQTVINQALLNGTISVGKELNTTQKLFITNMTGAPLAWHQVQDTGYWLDCRMVPVVTIDGRTEYKAVYTLIYSKDDAIRKVEGTHVLI